MKTLIKYQSKLPITTESDKEGIDSKEIKSVIDVIQILL
jgi:hypothetical protein